ncbi:MAG: ATP-dependent helicase [Symploca sp. SIO2E9]|nr:ATP-dependent helicase [Symploca sp. SIO2E9]
MFTPSKYQKAIFEWIVNGTGDAVVQAAAGSGKTTTLIEASKLLATDKAIFCGFNKHIVEELSGRLPKNMSAYTIHSIGLGTLRRKFGRKQPHINSNKYRQICKDRIFDISLAHGLENIDSFKLYQSLEQLCRFTRLTLTNRSDIEALWSMIAHFSLDVEYPELLIREVSRTLDEGEILARTARQIDFTDMLWLPHQWQLEPHKNDWIFVDECQDLSAAQLELVLKCRANGGRAIFVGDANQAIMGFAGANNDSVAQIIHSTSATVFPLSICYRCPATHIKLAQELVPEIEAAPNAIEGIVEEVNYKDLVKSVQEGDLILCRTTAPLIKLCIKLISQRIPARVRGRDIGKQLTTIVDKVAQIEGFSFSDFGKFLQLYKHDRVMRLQQRENTESQIESLCDRIQGIQVCYDEFDAQTTDELCKQLEDLFSDNRPSVMLSTIHRAKGLENHRVFILEPHKLPLQWSNQKDWEKEQELCLEYVALTRAKHSLFFVQH